MTVEQATVTEIKKLARMADNAQEVLVTADTLFPFTIFPDTIIVDRVKVTIKRRDFFSLSRVTSIQIEDVLNVEANSGPFFGSLRIWTRFFSNAPLKVNYLREKDALAIKEVLQGFIIARHKKIDCTKIGRDKLTELLQELGKEAPT